MRMRRTRQASFSSEIALDHDKAIEPVRHQLAIQDRPVPQDWEALRRTTDQPPAAVLATAGQGRTLGTVSTDSISAALELAGVRGYRPS
jgi:hypothetical protein